MKKKFPRYGKSDSAKKRTSNLSNKKIGIKSKLLHPQKTQQSIKNLKKTTSASLENLLSEIPLTIEKFFKNLLQEILFLPNQEHAIMLLIVVLSDSALDKTYKLLYVDYFVHLCVLRIA